MTAKKGTDWKKVLAQVTGYGEQILAPSTRRSTGNDGTFNPALYHDRGEILKAMEANRKFRASRAKQPVRLKGLFGGG